MQPCHIDSVAGMAYPRVRSLFVLTLLQLCRAEISDKQQEWYSANVINDGFQPKPISEIFSTDPPFSSTNPIVVLPKSSTQQDKSSSFPPSSISDDFTKTSIIPLPPSSPLPPTISTFPPQISSDLTSRFPSQPPQVEITQFTELTQPPSQTGFQTQRDLRQTTQSIPPVSSELLTTLEQGPPTPIGRFIPQNVPQTTFTQDQPPSSTPVTPGPLPYFVIYQQGPQNVDNESPGGLFGKNPGQQPSTPPGSTVIIQRTSTTSTRATRTTSTTEPPVPRDSTIREPTSRRPTTLTSREPSTRITSTQPLRIQVPISVGPAGPVGPVGPIGPVGPLGPVGPVGPLGPVGPVGPLGPEGSVGPLGPMGPVGPVGPQAPIGPTTLPPTLTQYPIGSIGSIGSIGRPVRIRVVGPRGSITHVNINPIAIIPTTTTKRPTTTRTRKTPKPRKNTYEACLSGCEKKRREPICAIPLSSTWIDPEKLKGFPSVCHMACFNSYKKEAYEILMDGRCGRFRTRIQTFDSKTKLKREELNKAQYTVDGNDETIVEVSALRH